MDVQKWLDSEPLPEEVKTKDGAKYIPYKTIIDKLYQLSGHEWSTVNFKETYIPIGKRILVSGNIEIEVKYKLVGNDNLLVRRLSGGANFLLNKSSNPHPTGTIKSLSIMNAVKPLGKQFGWGLNPENEEEKTLSEIHVEKKEVSAEVDRLKKLIEQCPNAEELKTFLVLAKSNKIMADYNKKLKSFK